MDSESVGSIDMANNSSLDALSFTQVVDTAIMSSSWSDFGESRVQSFASLVDSAIRSDTNSTSPRKSEASFSGKSSFANSYDPIMRTYPARLFLAELEAATNNFSFDNMTGRFGTEYRGKLVDGSEVTIKRVGTLFRPSFELASLSGLRHKNLVGLVGLCEENHERFFVNEYMENGDLFHHLHENGSSVLNSWRMRIKIALDVSQGMEYLRKYAISSFIYTEITSCNILLDATQTARVSDFGRRRRSGSAEHGFGIVLLELLTGKKPIYESGEDGCSPLSVADLAVPIISAGYLLKILDPRVGPPNVNEAEALELVAFTAIHCVNDVLLTMSDIVINLDRALALCYKIGSHVSR